MTPVVFDLDGTLIDSLPNVTDAANAVLREVGLAELPASEVAGFVGWGEQVFMDRLIAATNLDPALKPQLMERFIQHYVVVGSETRLIAGAEEVLRVFKENGVRTGLCTNKPRVPLLPVLASTPLGALLDAVVAGDDLAARKPDPAPLRHVVDMLGATTCLYVGDSQIDAETAVRAGVPFALFTEGIRTTPVAAIPHDFAFDDFAELPAIYRKLVRA